MKTWEGKNGILLISKMFTSHLYSCVKLCDVLTSLCDSQAMAHRELSSGISDFLFLVQLACLI